MAVGANNGSWVFGGGSITTSGALTKSGSGTLTLNSANLFSSITHSGGVISLGNAGAVGAGAINWTSASTLQTSALTSNVTIANAITLSGTGDRTFNMYATSGGGGTNTVELSGQITGTATRIYLNNSASGAFNPQYIFSNNTNSFTANIHLNRGGIQISSNE
jgi:fibronectin-binding autotransporter adhesin